MTTGQPRDVDILPPRPAPQVDGRERARRDYQGYVTDARAILASPTVCSLHALNTPDGRATVLSQLAGGGAAAEAGRCGLRVVFSFPKPGGSRKRENPAREEGLTRR